MRLTFRVLVMQYIQRCGNRRGLGSRLVDVEQTLPIHAQLQLILGVDWDDAERGFDIHLDCFPKSHDLLNDVIHGADCPSIPISAGFSHLVVDSPAP